MTEVAIVSAARTPIGSFGGSLASITAADLGANAIRAALQRAGVDGSEVSDVIMGHVLTAGCGQNTARQAAMASGIPDSVTALTINQVCGSGLRAVALGHQAIQCGDASVVVCGGHESMSQSAHCAHLRDGQRMGELALVDTMIKDGLWDAFNGYHMGTTAENVAEKFKLDRQTQDQFAATSQQRAEAAQQAGRFADEISPVTVTSRKGDTVVDTDEYPRSGTTEASLGKLKPAFSRDGSVTAGNASGINDGAAALVLMSVSEATKRGLEPLGIIRSWATRGVDPAIMGTGPIPSSQAALEKAGWSIDDLDLVEANEAFAAQACAVNQAMGWDPSIVNVNGGAIALGHPIGASGARVLTTLLYEMKKREAHKGLATLCIGGGMGVALCVER
ncbi:MAG: acetyl-CoA C-acetyltransferase [Granulosicoccus sp.]|nr:acetyl-CoA C-acetyltransferase [Granulosicoccus sp.]